MVTFLKGFNKILLVMIIIKGYSILKMRIISALDIRHYKGMNATSKQLNTFHNPVLFILGDSVHR